jgi:AraC family transcriptional activator of pobA
MIKDQNIPLYKSNSFGKVYFDTAPKLSSTDLAAGTQYFDIHFRCNCKGSIQAHRLDFYMIFLVTEGEGVHTFGLQEHYIRKNMLCFLGPSMVSAWQAEAEEQLGYFCSFSDDYFNLGRERKHFLSQLPFFQIDGNAVLQLTDEQAQYYQTLFQLMQAEHNQRSEYSDDILRGHLQVILNKAYAQYGTDTFAVTDTSHAAIRLLKAFTTLYIRDFETLNEGKVIKLKKIADYADELGISQNHLNDTIKTLTGKSAGQLVKDHLIKQATMSLKHSSESISEIAYRLGYDDPSYFSRYYKNQTGLTPVEFRSRHGKQ